MRIETIIFNPIYIEIPEYSLKRALKAYIESLVQGLNVFVIDVQKINSRYTLIELDGDDAEVVIRYLKRVFGCKLSHKDIKVGYEYSGRIKEISEVSLAIDIGIKEQSYVEVNTLQLLSKILRKKPNTLKPRVGRIMYLLGLTRYIPFVVKIVTAEKDRLRGIPGRRTLNMFRKWLNDRLDRVVVAGSLRASLDKVLRKTKLYKSIIRVDRIGFLEHAVVCKFGVFADEVAEILRKNGFSRIATFMPRKLRKLVE